LPVGESQYTPVGLELVEVACVTGLDVTSCTFAKGTSASDDFLIYILGTIQKTVS